MQNPGTKPLPERTATRARRRPQLFTLMLAAFVLVIVLGVGGMAGFYSLAISGQEARTISRVEGMLQEFEVGGSAALLRPTALDPNAIVYAGQADVWRGVLSAGLALAAVLVGLATFFSRRISRPISRLTQAARTMAGGDLSVRVPGHGVREINDLSDAFNSMAHSVAEADRQRRQLTADVAHELRTPLSIIKGRLEGMQDGVYHPTPDQVALLLDETALLERLIEDLRLLAQADAGQLPLYMERFNPAHLVHTVARSFAPAAEAAGITLHVALPPSGAEMPDVYADPQRIAQVLGNLLSNAIRHTPAGGYVTVGAQAEGRPGDAAACLYVSDTGAGIPPDQLPHIFNRFWKADRSRARSGGGAGLGLAIAHRIVEAHGGLIWARSEPGAGTTVAFSLPGVEAQEPPHREIRAEQSALHPHAAR
ncbi:MAG TPA: ATP-binding protein [Chloroflexia bacterium]|nr:ATP-binding protein [Chloroflexia bacterium]